MEDDNARQLLNDLICAAKEKGADSVDAVFAQGDSLSVSWRGGKVDMLERAEGADLGLRAFIGQKQASCSTSDMSKEALKEIVDRVLSMAKAAPEDPYCGLADEGDIAKNFPSLDLSDDFDIEAPHLIELAREMEKVALDVEGVSQCESTNAGASKSSVFLAASNGFSGGYERTHYALSASALAGEGTAMERDGESVSVTHKADLPCPFEIGKKAGEKAVKNLGARKMPSCQASVVFHPEEAAGLLGNFAGVIKGSAIARGTSFLKEFMGKQVFAEGITIIDDPFRMRGLRSRSFDGEGLLPEKRTIVENGVLQTWLLDLRSARQLGLKSTGHASRGTSGVPAPSPNNFYMNGGPLIPQELMSDIKEGFYVTETMGMGVNGVTGDYSLAARGFWIEDGEISFPVNEMTIAGNLKEMFLHMTPANDLVFRHGIDAPTLRVEGMTIAGV
ncbi:MAG TPA: modulator protein [Rhodospirillaceae bacterium]|nr:modulator protein [Rhodospirillaceae bacterium]